MNGLSETPAAMGHFDLGCSSVIRCTEAGWGAVSQQAAISFAVLGRRAFLCPIICLAVNLWMMYQ